MRYRIKAKVEGSLVLDEDVSVERDDILVEFLSDRKGMLGHIAVSTKVDPEEFKTSVGPGQGETVATFVLESNPQVHNTLIEELQRLESNLSFRLYYSLERIHWQTVEEERIPESPDEEALCSLTGVMFSQEESPPPVVQLARDSCENIVSESLKYNYLVTHKAFALESMRDFGGGRYIQSFYNSFFILESFYGRGKTGTKNVIREFSKSDELMKAISQNFHMISGKADLHEFYEEEGCKIDIEGTLHLLVKVRGKLHHYYSGSSRRQGTPFNQRHFRDIANLARFVALYAISLKELSISEGARRVRSS